MHYYIEGYWRATGKTFTHKYVTTYPSLGSEWSNEEIIGYEITEEQISECMNGDNDSFEFFIASYYSCDPCDVLQTRRVSTSNDCTIGFSYDGDRYSIVIADEFDLFEEVFVDTLEEVKPRALALYNEHFGAN